MASHTPRTAEAAPHLPGPFAFAEIDRAERVLREAGFANVKGTRTQLKLSFGGGVRRSVLDPQR